MILLLNIQESWQKERALFSGGACGANLYGAIRLAKEIDRSVNIVTFFSVFGFRYMNSIFS